MTTTEVVAPGVVHPWTIQIVLCDGDYKLAALRLADNETEDGIAQMELALHEWAIVNAREITQLTYEVLKSEWLQELRDRMREFPDAMLVRVFEAIKGNPVMVLPGGVGGAGDIDDLTTSPREMLEADLDRLLRPGDTVVDNGNGRHG